MAEGAVEQAASTLKELIDRGSTAFQVHSLLGRCYLEMENPRAAYDILWPLVGDSPTESEFVVDVVRAGIRCGRVKDARIAAKKFTHTNKASFHGILDIAHAFREEGSLHDAISIYKLIMVYAKVDHIWTVENRHGPDLEGFVATACEYGGYSIEAEHWVSRYEKMRERRTQEIMGSEQVGRPIFLGRLAGSIGDLASRVDAIVKLKKLGTLGSVPSTLFLPPEDNVANRAFVEIIKGIYDVNENADAFLRERESTSWMHWREYEKIELADGRVVHNTLACALAEQEWLEAGRPPVFQLPTEIRESGLRALKRHGFKDGDWFVSLHVREPGFYREGKKGFRSESLHRCADIRNFDKAIRWILDQGGWVVRLGDESMAPLPFEHERCIDYAHAEWRQDDLDIFFMAECRYLLCTNSGPMCVASAFGKISGVTNYVPFAMPPLSPRNLFIPKLLFSREKSRYLTVAEMLMTPFRMANRSHLFEFFKSELDVDLVDNNREDIFEFTKDLHSAADGNLDLAFSYNDELEAIFNEHECHYIAKLAPSFARRYPEILSNEVNPLWGQVWDAVGAEWLQLSVFQLIKAGEVKAALRSPSWRETIRNMSIGERHHAGVLLGNHEAYDAAIKVLEDAVEDAPDSVSTWKALIGVIISADKTEKALEEYKRLLKVHPYDFSSWLDHGHFLRVLGRFDDAVSVFCTACRVAEAHPSSTRGQEGFLAAAYEYAGDSQTSRHWVGLYERERDRESKETLADNPLVISLGNLSSRIGDVAARFDLLKKGLELGLIDLPKDDFVIDSSQKYVNNTYVNLWREQLPFSPPEQADAVAKASWQQKRDLADVSMSDGRVLYYTHAYAEIQKRWIECGRGPVISLSPDQIEGGWRILERMGIKRDSWFVTLHVRDSGFFAESEVGLNSEHLHRSATIANYDQAIDWIISQGGLVVRLGDPSMTPIGPRKGLFDYAKSDLRSPEMDVFLMSQCRYLLGTNSGPMAICTSFGVPCGITNYVPVAFPACSPHNLVLPKSIWLKREKRPLTLDEMMRSPLGHANRYHLYRIFMDRFDAELRENTPEELLEFAQELHGWSDAGFDMKDARHKQVEAIFNCHNAPYISPIARCWLDRYEKLGCLSILSWPRDYMAEWPCEAEVVEDPAVFIHSPPHMGVVLSIPEIVRLIGQSVDFEQDSAGVLRPALLMARSGASVETLLTLAHGLRSLGLYSHEFKVLRCALREVPYDHNVRVEMAKSAKFMGYFDLAVECFHYSADRDPSHYVELADLELRRGRFRNALRAFERVVEISAPRGFHGMGIALSRLGFPTEAIVELERVIELAPDSLGTWREMFVAARSSLNHPMAVKCYRRLRELDPEDQGLDYDFVEMQIQFGQHKDVIDILERLSKRIFGDLDHRNQFGHRYLAVVKSLNLDTMTVDFKNTIEIVETEMSAPSHQVSSIEDPTRGRGIGGDYVRIVRDGILGFLSIDADAKLYILASSIWNPDGVTLSPEDFKKITENEIFLQEFRTARLNGKWVHNDRAEYLTTTVRSMVGVKRLNNVIESIYEVIEKGVPGDFVECGAWRGGVGVLMRAVMKSLGADDRRIWLCDSLQGLPKSDIEYEVKLFGPELDWVSVSLDEVRRSFTDYGLFDECVQIVPGWFSDTLYKMPVEAIAILRLDADYYCSTMESLAVLYDKVSSGGIVIIDDYYSVGTCAEAISTFFEARGMAEPAMQDIDKDGVFWRKQ